MAATENVITELGTVTKVPVKILNELISKLNLCIGSAIHDALISNEQSVILNLGIGNLGVNLADMSCKFVPSKDLKAIIKRCMDEKIDPLEKLLEDSLVEKLISICQEVL